MRNKSFYKHKCNCGKQYLHHSNLYTHKQLENDIECLVLDGTRKI